MADRVSEALRRLRARLSEAEAHVDATRKRARKASARRLREILAGPPTGRVAGLRDLVLTSADRAELERVLAEALPRRRIRVRTTLSTAVGRLVRHARYRRRGLIGLLVVAAPALGLAGLIRARTLQDAVPVRLSMPYTIPWTLPGGQTVGKDEAAGAEFVWFRRDGKNYLRRWFDAQGYGEVEVPDWFTRGALTERR